MAEKREKKSKSGFSEEEISAMKERRKEMKSRSKKVDGESEVLEKISQMNEEDRKICSRLHELIKSTAPELTPKTWYGMPAYYKDGKLICFFQNMAKFKVRYTTLGFSDKASLDEGNMWPISYAITELNPGVEEKIKELVRKGKGDNV